MRLFWFVIGVTILCFPTTCPAQGRQPPVSAIFDKFDANKDGVLSGKEVAGGRYERQFRRWDENQDDRVSSADIIKFRRKFGIAADGTRLAARPFTVPKISDLPRIKRGARLPREAARNSAFLLSTSEHAVNDDGYIILTDHQSQAFIKPLARLAEHHQGQVIIVPKLATLLDHPDELKQLRSRLRAASVRYVAIAPRLESFRENLVMAMLELLTTLDSDPQIDAFPGYLVASNAQSLEKLVEQSIAHQPLKASELNPVALSQVLRDSETRSLQKAAMLRTHFRSLGMETSIAAVYGKRAPTAPRLKGEQVWNLATPDGGGFIKTFPDELAKAFAQSNLVVMHGHGVPGMSCSVDLAGIPEVMDGKILLSGSCFSASPIKSDLPAMREAPGGYEVKQQRDAFVVRAVDRGAIVAFGHQRLSSGFPHLYPVLGGWLDGQTVGQSYQQLLNGLIEMGGWESGAYQITQAEKRPRQNSLLYVVIGDPALQPFVRITPR